MTITWELIQITHTITHMNGLKCNDEYTQLQVNSVSQML